MADDSAITVKGSCSIGGEDVGLTGLKAVMAVNAWPLFNIEAALYADESASAKLVTVAELKNKLASWQDRINGGSLPASFSVDGGGGSIKVDGRVASVGLDVSVGRCRASAVVLPSYTELDALNLGLYIPCLKESDADKGAMLTLYAEARKNCEGNMTLTRYTKELVKLAVSKYDNSVYKKKGGDIVAKVADGVHSANTKVLGTFYELLDNSEGIDDVYGINGLISNSVSNVEPIGAAIVSSLMRPTGSFLSAICSYANLFRLFYKPGIDNVGMLCPKSDMYTKMDTEASAKSGVLSQAALAITGNAFSTSQFPLGTVYTVTDFSGLDCESGGSNLTGGFNGQEGGTTRSMQIAPPVWLSPYLLPSVKTNSEGGGAQTQSSNPSDMEGSSGGASDDDAAKKNKEVLSGLLSKWCEMEYYDQKWGNYTVAITVPGVAVGCGGRMLTEMGSGFLRASQCMLSLSQGGRGYCRTILTFSHFKYSA